MANDKDEKFIDENTEGLTERLMVEWRSLTYETGAMKINEIIKSLNSPYPNMAKIKADFQNAIVFIDGVLKKTFPSSYLSKEQLAEQERLLSSMSFFQPLDEIKNFTYAIVSSLLVDSVKNLVASFEEIKKNPTSISALKIHLINFEKLLHFLDKVDCCRIWKGADFLKEFNKQLITLKDEALIKDLIFKYNLGAKDFDFEQFKTDNPNFDLFKLGAIKILNDKLSNALTHEEINDLILGDSSQSKKK